METQPTISPRGASGEESVTQKVSFLASSNTTGRRQLLSLLCWGEERVTILLLVRLPGTRLWAGRQAEHASPRPPDVETQMIAVILL